MKFDGLSVVEDFNVAHVQVLIRCWVSSLNFSSNAARLWFPGTSFILFVVKQLEIKE